jgi:1-acyl-sn-glycerol-3-phosphate acyltransferase
MGGAAPPIHLNGNALARAALRLAGWTLRFADLPAKQGVLIVYPHTSNWDFVLGIVAKWAIGIPVTFWGKDTLFRVPLFGRWLRWLGGVPVDRHAPRGIVGQMGDELIAARAQDRFLWLALSPEGTRRRTPAWRSGFYHVACKAQVPVGLVFLDYGRREVGVDHYLMMSGRADDDLRRIEQQLHQPRGMRPERASPIRFESP